MRANVASSWMFLIALFFVSKSCEVFGTKRCKLNIKNIYSINGVCTRLINANIGQFIEKSKSFLFSFFVFSFFTYLCSPYRVRVCAPYA